MSIRIVKVLTKVQSCQSPLERHRFEIDQVAARKYRKHTFAMYPQEGGARPPLVEDTTLEEPAGSSFVVSFARDIVIYRGIRGR